MRRLKKHKALLVALCNLSPQQRKALLTHATKTEVSCLSEVALNLLENNLPVSNAVRSKLKKHRKAIRRLACPRNSISKRRKILVQEGGFLPLLLKPALGLLGGLLSGSLFGGS